MKRYIYKLLVILIVATFVGSVPVWSKTKLTPEEKDLSVRRIEAKNGVVASANPIASKIGIEILKKGGNAIDAAVATAFTLGLVEPNASGPGGSGYMIIYKKNKKPVFYEYMEESPEKLSKRDYKEIRREKSYENGVGAMVPGTVAGLLKALEDHGTMPIGELLKPVIELAEEGFIISPHLAVMMAESYEKIMQKKEAARIFLNDGLPYSEGELIKNPDYAETIRLIVEKGRDGFYKGKTAKAIMKANPWITQKDLESYEPLILEPLSTDYRGYTIVTSSPSSCGAAILQSLNMLENFDLAKIGADNPLLYHLWAEALNLAQIDRYHYVGDRRFAKSPVETLISQKFADQRAKLIDISKAMGKVTPGIIPEDVPESPSTSHVSIIDKQGNAVSMTNTIGLVFGYGIVPQSTGFVLNSHFSNFSTGYKVNKYAPGKRPRSTMSPTMVFDKKGDLKLVIGSPGAARILSTIPQVISNVIDHGMEIQAAIDRGRIHKIKGKLYIEGNVPDKTVEFLKKMKHEIIMKPPTSSYFGGVHAVFVDQIENDLDGGADKRRDGKALGY